MQYYAVEFVGTDPLEFDAKALIPGLLTQRSPMSVTNYLVIHLQYSADLHWEKTHGGKNIHEYIQNEKYFKMTVT